MYNHILVPIDGSQQAQRALDNALSLASNLSGDVRLSILHVNSSVVLNEQSIIDLTSTLEEEGQRVLKIAENKAKAAGVDFEVMVASGEPAVVINKTAKGRGVDLIVMGSRGVGLMTEILLGSVSHAVVQHAHCPVLIVK